MTLDFNRKRFGAVAADYVWSCGSSPATYGALFALCIISPYLPVGGSSHSSTSLDEPWIWFYLVTFLPPFLHPHAKYGPFLSRAYIHISGPVLLLVGLWWVRPMLRSMTALQWLYLYYIKSGLFRYVPLYHETHGSIDFEYALLGF